MEHELDLLDHLNDTVTRITEDTLLLSLLLDYMDGLSCRPEQVSREISENLLQRLGDSLEQLDIEAIGPLFEHHERFPDRTNTEFVEVLDEGHVRMRVWERGSGETLACGTGACAVLAACVLNGRTGNEAQVELPGGTLSIRWDREKNRIYMTGPAVEVYHGEIDIPDME